MTENPFSGQPVGPIGGPGDGPDLETDLETIWPAVVRRAST